MSFLNNLGQKISDVSQTTIKKTKDLADTAKLNLNISEEEHKINTAYEQIGKTSRRCRRRCKNLAGCDCRFRSQN